MARTAYVNLSSGEIRSTETSLRDLHRFIGGRGLGAKLLYDLVGPEVEPLSPDNALIFTAGPLVGTPWPTSSRLHVTFKSPLTGIYGYANSGGFFGAELRHAGYDAVVVTGQARLPVYIQIFDQEIAIRDAGEIWGKTVSETDRALLGENPKARDGRIACIGPAGENLVKIAAIINDGCRAAARGGPGAVMGAKRLKALHVRAAARETLPPELRAAAKTAHARIKADPHLAGLKTQGTVLLMAAQNMSGALPAKNHQVVQFPEIQKVSTPALDKYLLEHESCYGCPIGCSRRSEVPSGPYAGKVGGPEYETTNALGPMVWNANPEVILAANRLCNEYGLDTISTGVTIAFAMELHERGLLDDETLSLAWGDPDTVLGLIERIVYRQGIGDTLAEGARLAARAIGRGAERYAMHVKGMELPRQDPRVAKGFGLGHATSNRGADHLYALPTIDVASNWDAANRIFPAEIVPELMDPANETYKPDIVVYGEHFSAITDALGICKFSTSEEYSLLPADLAPGLAALWGEPVTEGQLLQIGERIVNLERLYNMRLGLSREDDALPERFTTEPVQIHEYDTDPETGETRISELPVREAQILNFDAMLDRYYALRGWDKGGRPTREVLARLDLLDCI